MATPVEKVDSRGRSHDGVVGRTDLIRALAALSPEDATGRAAIAETLGLASADGSSPRAPSDLPPRKPRDVPVRLIKPTSAGRSEAEREPLKRENRELSKDPVDSELEMLELPERIVVERVEIEPEAAAPPLRPLFRPTWTRGLLTRALSTPDDAGPPWLGRIVDLLAHGRPVRELPRLPVPTLRRGVQVLVDVGPGMTPFARDQRHLVAELRRTLTPDGVRVFTFVDAPWPTVQDDHDAVDYAPPVGGAPVLVLTDFGLAGTRRAGGLADWLAFVGVARRAGCDVVAFVPYPRDYWPAELAAGMHIVPWDHTTAVNDVRPLRRRTRSWR